MEELHPCWTCGGLNFWRSRDHDIHCAQCSLAHAHYLIAQRLRAVPLPLSQLGRAMVFIRAALKGAESTDAKAVIDAHSGHGFRIAPATLTQARRKLGLRSVKTRRGWLWTRPS